VLTYPFDGIKVYVVRLTISKGFWFGYWIFRKSRLELGWDLMLTYPLEGDQSLRSSKQVDKTWIFYSFTLLFSLFVCLIFFFPKLEKFTKTQRVLFKKKKILRIKKIERLFFIYIFCFILFYFFKNQKKQENTFFFWKWNKKTCFYFFSHLQLERNQNNIFCFFYFERK